MRKKNKITKKLNKRKFVAAVGLNEDDEKKNNFFFFVVCRLKRIGFNEIYMYKVCGSLLLNMKCDDDATHYIDQKHQLNYRRYKKMENLAIWSTFNNKNESNVGKNVLCWLDRP